METNNTMTTKNIQDVVVERVEELEKSLAETLKLWTDDAQAGTTANWYANKITQLVKEERERIREELLRRVEGEKELWTKGMEVAELVNEHNELVDTIKKHITSILTHHIV